MNPAQRLSSVRNWRTNLVGELSGNILEVGVGTGPNLAHYRSASRLWAIEPGLERAGTARRVGIAEGLDTIVQVALAESLPHADNSFDHVVSSLVFCSVTDQRLALAEIRRVLKPRGTLHMVEHVCPQSKLAAFLAGVATPGWRRVAKNCHLNRPTIERLHESGWTVCVHGRLGVFVRISAT